MHNFVTDYRWASVENAAGATVPAYALLRVTGRPGTAEFSVAQPNENDQGALIVNGECDIPTAIGGNTGRGNATPDSPVQILYNPADGTPGNGETWGAKAGEWWLRKGYTGYKIYGGADGSKVWAVPSCCEHEDCGCGTGPPPVYGCQVSPPPTCAPCLRAIVIDTLGVTHEIVLSPAAGFTGVCNYSGSTQPTEGGDYISIEINISSSGISSVVGVDRGGAPDDGLRADLFTCTSWDGVSCISLGEITHILGFISYYPTIVSICPSTDCPSPFGGGGGIIGGGTGGTGGGGAGCTTGICPPNYIGIPCPCCPGTRPVELNNGNWGCAPNPTGQVFTPSAIAPATDPIAYAEELTAGQVPVIGTTTTTTNAPVTGATVPITLNKAAELEITIIGWQTGGTAGTVGDSVYVKTFDYFKNVAGVVSRIGGPGAPAPLTSRNDDFTSPANFNATISGTNVLIPVTGNTNRNYRWQVAVKKREY